MYQHYGAIDMGGLATSVENFCRSAGFQVTVETGEIQFCTSALYDYDGIMYDTGKSMLSYNLIGKPDVTFGAYFPCTRVLIKDPKSSQTHKLIFYSFGGNRPRRDKSIEVYYIDFHMNDKKIGTLHSLPSTCEGIDMFAGTTSEGKLWAHFAVEEEPQIYMHFGLGSMEKLLDFTGGDFCTFHYCAGYTVGGANALAYCSFVGQNTSFSVNAFYCLDLDVKNKVDSANAYRTLSGGNQYYRKDFEPGHISGYCDISTTIPTDPNGKTPTFNTSGGGGGEMATSLFPMPNAWSGNAPLFPIIAYANNGKNMLYSGLCGYFSGVRTINIANYLPRDEIVLGSDKWMVFPITAKSGYITYPYTSYNHGYAILK